MKSTRTTAAVLGLAVVMLATACSDRSDPLDIGFKRVSLDLVFKDAEKAPPADPEQVRTVITYFTQDFGEVAYEEDEPLRPIRRAPRVEPRDELPFCDTADPNETPEIPALSALAEPPRVGTYRRKNTGTIGLQSPIISGTLPYPPFTEWTLTELQSDLGTLATNPSDDDDLPLDAQPPPPDQRAEVYVAPVVTRFKVTRNVTRDARQVDTYQYYGDRGDGDLDSSDSDGDGLYLVKRETFSERFGDSVFEPTPPIMVTAIGDEHQTQEAVTSSGIDRRTGAAMTIQTKIVGREDIDVCGEMIGTYRVEFDEIFVTNIDGVPSVSGTVETGQKNIWNITFNLGLTITREEIHRIDRFSVGGVPASVRWDYVSTLMNFEPEPLEDER